MNKILVIIILSLLWISYAEATDYTQSASCRGAWLFEAGSGTTAVDSSANGNNLVADTGDIFPTWYNTTLPKTYSTWALDFNGSTNDLFHSDNDSLSTLGATTMVAWVNLDDATSYTIIQKFQYNPNNGEYQFYTYSDDKLYANFITTRTAFIGRGYNTAITGDEGAWHHYAVSYDGGILSAGIKIFRDGVQKDDVNDQTGAYSSMPNSSMPLYIGWGNPGTGGHYSNGKEDEIALFAAELTSTQINDIMDNGLVGSAPPATRGQVIMIN